MGLITPLALGALALALPIILFYMLKLRRQETVVSSTFLWMQALRDIQANAPWQRLQRNLLLFLQLLILALLALAAARPFYESPAIVRGNIIVLLDGSASMQATDVKSSRFEVAKSAIDRMVDDMGPDDRMTIVQVASHAEVVVSGSRDKAGIKTALAGLRAGNGPANYADAVALAVASAERVEGSSIIIVSDGGIGDIPADRVPVPLHYVPVGASSNNVAISSIALRDSAQGVQLFMGLANHGDNAQRGLASLYVNGRLYDSREFDLGAKAESGLSWTDLPPDTELAQARLEVTDDLAVDNAAWALRSPSSGLKVLMVSSGNLFLERALSLLPNVELSKMPADSTTLPEGFDLYILEGIAPPDLPRGSVLFVNPPATTSLVNVQGEVENLAVTKFQIDDPLLRFVELADLRIARANQIEPPEWARVLIQSGNVPLLLAGEKDGRRVAILPFDLHASNLPLLVAFPILTANLVGWLGPPNSLGLSPEVKAGGPVTLNLDPKARDIEVRRPDGSRWQANADRASVIYAETNQLGVYEVVQHLEGGSSSLARFVVNLADPRESDITPAASVPLQGDGAIGAGQALTARRELWWPLLAAALAVLLVEWWVDQRRRGRRKPIRLGARTP